MITTLRGRDYISTQDFTVEEMQSFIDVASDLKRKFAMGEPHRLLDDKTGFLLFFDNSTRTRNSFEAGMTQLGGHAHFISAETSQIAHGESPKDTGIILSRYGHGIMVRHDLEPYKGNAYMREIAKYADKPVINMQCDIDHPCQTMADLMTIQEKFGRNTRGLKVAVSWAYAPSYSKPLSVPQGLAMLMTRFGMDVTLAHPPEYALMPEVMETARKNAEIAGVKFEVADNMEDAFADADIVYPKSWGVMDLFGNNEEAMKVASQYKNWICDEKLMKTTKKTSVYMHCLPADRGNEVTDAVIDGPRSIVYDEAENRLHTCKAIMALTM